MIWGYFRFLEAYFSFSPALAGKRTEKYSRAVLLLFGQNAQSESPLTVYFVYD